MLHFRVGKVFSFVDAFRISIGRESFFKGISISVVFWFRGVSLTVTTKKIYKEYRIKYDQQMAEHKERLEREKANPPT